MRDGARQLAVRRNEMSSGFANWREPFEQTTRLADLDPYCTAEELPSVARRHVRSLARHAASPGDVNVRTRDNPPFLSEGTIRNYVSSRFEQLGVADANPGRSDGAAARPRRLEPDAPRQRGAFLV